MSNCKLKEDTRREIKELVIKGYRDSTISNKLEIPYTTVNHWTKKIRLEFEYTRRQIIESFDYEYQRLNESFDLRRERINELRDRAEKNGDVKILLECEKFLHQIDVDKWKLLGDSDVVLAVKRMKDARISNTTTKGTTEPVRTITN